MCVSQNDPDYGCGTSTCTAACDLPNVQTQACASHACAVGTCDPGFKDCNGMPTDGCEINTQTDKAHCGSCTKACNVADTCQSGQCITPCGALPDVINDYLCWVYPNSAAGKHVGLRGGSNNQDLDPFNGSGSCTNPTVGAQSVFCNLGPAPLPTILAMAGLMDQADQFHGTLAGTLACDSSTCQGHILGYKQGVQCGEANNGSIVGTPGCITFAVDANFGNRMAVKFTP